MGRKLNSPGRGLSLSDERTATYQASALARRRELARTEIGRHAASNKRAISAGGVGSMMSAREHYRPSYRAVTCMRPVPLCTPARARLFF